MEQKNATNVSYKFLTPIAGQPAYYTIIELCSQINSNNISIHSYIGGLIIGHKPHPVTPVVYNTHSKITHVSPIKPSYTPVISPFSTSRHTTSLRLDHSVAHNIWQIYEDTDNELKGLLLETGHNMFTKMLRNRTLRYTHIANT